MERNDDQRIIAYLHIMSLFLLRAHPQHIIPFDSFPFAFPFAISNERTTSDVLENEIEETKTKKKNKKKEQVG